MVNIYRSQEFMKNCIKKKVVVLISYIYGIDSQKVKHNLELFTKYDYSLDSLLFMARSLEDFLIGQKKRIPEGTFYDDIYREIEKKYYISDVVFNG